MPALLGSATDDLRTRLLKGVVLGGSLSVSAAVVWALVDLMRRNPVQFFALLQQWGPWFVLTVLGMSLVWDIAKRLLDKLDRMTDATLKQAEGMSVLSVAVAKIAEKDDRQYEEMRLMVQYASRTASSTIDMLRGMQEHMKQLSEGQAEMKEMLGPSLQRRRATDDDRSGS